MFFGFERTSLQEDQVPVGQEVRIRSGGCVDRMGEKRLAWFWSPYGQAEMSIARGLGM